MPASTWRLPVCAALFGLTPAFAQQVDTDAFQLRIEAINEVERAYAAGDVDALKRIATQTDELGYLDSDLERLASALTAKTLPGDIVTALRRAADQIEDSEYLEPGSLRSIKSAQHWLIDLLGIITGMGCDWAASVLGGACENEFIACLEDAIELGLTGAGRTAVENHLSFCRNQLQRCRSAVDRYRNYCLNEY